ncbi:ComF family protein [Geothrix terrae]|uniref:ComF family protein n=1 Tax=Geothrix terrae TaxID=2922720 RepID=UPI001FAE4516|nr:phosphoribosyltransferase family protein [Geothrix terrae]
MLPATLRSRLAQARMSLLLCRGCLGPVGPEAEAGLCARCWQGLQPLPEGRCLRCALPHAEGPCPEPVAWELGDALWDYHGGRPPFGALVLPDIKRGEMGWRRALLRRLGLAALPDWVQEVDQVTSAPSALPRRLWRGFDLAAEAGRVVADRTGRPYETLLAKGWWRGRQATRTESARRRLPRKAVTLRQGAAPRGIVLLVDDVWTTGTTLLRCAQALKDGGADEVRVLTLFRAM